MNYSILMFVAALAIYGLTGLVPYAADQSNIVDGSEESSLDDGKASMDQDSL